MIKIDKPPITTGFLDLPLEIKEEIYLYVVIQLVPVILRVYDEVRLGIEPALAAVNRQMRAESLVVFYCYNTFHMKSFNDAVICLANLEPELVKELRHVRVLNEAKGSRENQLGFIFRHLNANRRGLCGLRKDALAVRICVDIQWETQVEWTKVVDIPEFEVVGTDGAWYVRSLERDDGYDPQM